MSVPPNGRKTLFGTDPLSAYAVKRKSVRRRHDALSSKTYFSTYLQNVGEVVEYGAGSGRITIPLAKQNHKVLAVDNDPIMLK